MRTLTTLRLNKSNPRQINQAQLDKLCASIKRDPEFMRLRPIVVDENGTILGGNQRFKACVALGMTEVPDEWVVCASDLTAEQRKRFILVDNAPPGMSGEWDKNMLEDDFADLDLDSLGFSSDDDDEESVLEEEQITPFKRVHVLLSVSVDKAADFIEAAQTLADEYYAEVHYSQN